MPTYVSGSGYANGINALADAFAQAPMNRARIRQMEFEQTLRAADAERQRLRDAETARRANAQEGRDASLHPGAIDIQQGTIQKNQQDLRQGEQTYQFNEKQNPLLLQKSEADVATAQTKANLDQRRYDAYDPLIGATTNRIMSGLDEAVVPKIRQGSGLPVSPPVFPQDRGLPGLRPEAPTMDFPTDEGDSAIRALLDRARRAGDVEKLRPDVEAIAGGLVFEDSPDPSLVSKSISDTTETLADQFPPMPGMPTAEAESGWTGDSIDAQMNRVMSAYKLKVDNGLPTTPQEDADYALAWAKRTEPKKQIVKDPLSGADILVDIPGSPPAGYPPPRVSGAITPPAPTPPTAGGIPVSVAGQAPPGQSTAQSSAPGVKTTQITGAPPHNRTEEENKNFNRAVQTQNNIKELKRILGVDPVTGEFMVDPQTGQRVGGVPSWGDQTLADNPIADFTRSQASSAAQQWGPLALQTVEPILRAATGAAGPVEEMPRFVKAWVPQVGEDDQTVRMKLKNLEMMAVVFNQMSADKRQPTFKDMSPEEVLAFAYEEAQRQGYNPDGAAPAAGGAVNPDVEEALKIYGPSGQ